MGPKGVCYAPLLIFRQGLETIMGMYGLIIVLVSRFLPPLFFFFLSVSVFHFLFS